MHAAQPYPAELEEWVALPSGIQALLRPIRPEDEPQHLELLHNLSLEDSRWRFFVTIKDMNHDEIARFTTIDYDREMAFIATRKKPGDGPETLGVVRAVILDDAITAEFAIVVRTGEKGRGLGWALMDKMLRYLAARNVVRVEGEVMSENHNMMAFIKDFGFTSRFDVQDGVVRVWKPLTPQA